MEAQNTIVNKVAQSGLITFDLATLQAQGERVLLDMKDYLFQGLILREKDFREFIKDHDWAHYEGKNVAIICSTDAIIPTWAYLLLANRLEPFANEFVFGDLQTLETILYRDAIAKLDMDQFKDERVIIKGCADIHIPESAFIYFTTQLSKVVKNIMYGEACSSVPIYKRKP